MKSSLHQARHDFEWLSPLDTYHHQISTRIPEIFVSQVYKSAEKFVTLRHFLRLKTVFSSEYATTAISESS